MKKRTTKTYHNETPIRLSNKGPYNSSRKDQSTSVDFLPPNAETHQLEISETECYQYIDTNDFFKKQHMTQLYYIKEQQNTIENLQIEKDNLDSLNQNLQNHISKLSHISNQKDFKIKKLNGKLRKIKRLFK